MTVEKIETTHTIDLMKKPCFRELLSVINTLCNAKVKLGNKKTSSMASAALYGLKYQSRCLVSQLGANDKHCFLVGTNSVRESNEVFLLNFGLESIINLNK